jgi:hypothetical protein
VKGATLPDKLCEECRNTMLLSLTPYARLRAEQGNMGERWRHSMHRCLRGSRVPRPSGTATASGSAFFALRYLSACHRRSSVSKPDSSLR